MRNTVILALIGMTLFFLVLTVFYFIMNFTSQSPKVLEPFGPFIIFTGFFIFLIGAFLVAFSIFKAFTKN